MEPIDAAFEKFQRLVYEINQPAYWDSIKSEADTRMKIVDPIFTEVLGWPKAEIHLESTAGKKFIDYRCTIHTLNRLIIEAKKEARDLGINEDHAARFFQLNGAVFSGEAAQEGIEGSRVVIVDAQGSGVITAGHFDVLEAEGYLGRGLGSEQIGNPVPVTEVIAAAKHTAPDKHVYHWDAGSSDIR